ncbi:MAG: dihydrodipicolinate synthase family protein [Clostridia bacterium]|nr:dihydrodipicolinate synthase family protein [Clostridia bacterium]
MLKRLYGVVCATITPMLPDGSVDLESAGRLYRCLTEAGITGLYPNGTNGESLSLSYDERCALAERCTVEATGKSSVYVQCGAASAEETRRNILFAQSCGADGAGIMTPVFFPVDEEGMEAYYDQMLQATPELPAYVYNIPSRTGNDVSPALLGRLMGRYPRLYGIKYSAPDLLRIGQYVHCCGDRRPDVLIGCDPLAVCCLDMGGVGWVSGPAAAFRESFVRLHRQSGTDRAGMKETQAWIAYLSSQLAGIPEIPAVKYLLMRRGIIRHDACRSPLRPLRSGEKERLDRLLALYLEREGRKEG